jgi:hypothetical protein
VIPKIKDAEQTSTGKTKNYVWIPTKGGCIKKMLEMMDTDAREAFMRRQIRTEKHLSRTCSC